MDSVRSVNQLLSDMKKEILSVLALLLCFAVNGQEFRTTSTLKEAVVYLQGANLEYSANITLQKGAQDIYIDGLCPSLDMESLKVKAGKGVLISATEFTQGTVVGKVSQARIKQMKDSLVMLKTRKTDTETQITVNAKMLTLLEEGVLHNMNGRQSSSTSAEISGNLEVYRKNAESLLKKQAEQREALAAVDNEIASLEKRLAKEESLANRKCGVIKLSVTSPAAGSVPFEISCYTGNARWTPVYDINVESTEKPVALQAKALVWQRTGLDWEKVKLTLSNGRPNRTNTAPVFSAWYLRFPQEVYAGRAMMNSVKYKAAGEVAFAAADMADGIEEEAVMVMDDYVELGETDLEVSYAISLPYDIPGDGTQRSIDLKKYEISADYFYYAAPKLSDEVYLMASLSDWNQYGLLPGQATVNYDGSFVGKTYIQSGTTDSTLDLTLGTDSRISVKYEMMKNLKSTATIGSNTTVYKGWKITVRNGRNKAVKLTVKDQYPVSTDKDIEVKLLDVTPAATFNKTQTGILTWEVELGAGETKEFSSSFSVKYPKDRSINL